ncbi:MAG: hypothetical protein KJ811_05095, partial [Candidatus Margulisbacteria bacterium]|nr:hypothetical protein [Candidatus Margulisiibacteriota bacterium]
MIKRLLIIFLIVVWANGALAQLADIGLNPMLLEGGARPLGMGGAFVAAPGDIYSLVYNPAGLAWAKGISVSSLGPQGVSFIQAYPNGNLSAFGLGVFTSKINDIPIAAGLANSNANIVSLSYATKLGFLQNVGLGITGKGLVRETLWRTGSIDQVGQGWDLDLGLLWKSDWWSVGLSGSNVLAAKTYEGGVILWDVADEEGIPALGRLGCQVKLIDDVDAPIIMDDRGLLISLELDRNRTGQAIYRAGSEWSVFKQYFFRLGFMQQWDGYRNKIIGNMTYGLGFRSNDWGIDLATYFEPIKEEHCLVLSGLYSPRDWVVVEKLDFEKPKFIMEQPIESLSLADNVVTYDDRIEIVGTVKRGVSVYINGAGVLLNDEHSFKANIPLDLGKNLIIVE